MELETTTRHGAFPALKDRSGESAFGSSMSSSNHDVRYVQPLRVYWCVCAHSLNHSRASGLATLAFVLTLMPERICLTATSILLILR